jgi:hypothetical protein
MDKKKSKECEEIALVDKEIKMPLRIHLPKNIKFPNNLKLDHISQVSQRNLNDKIGLPEPESHNFLNKNKKAPENVPQDKPRRLVKSSRRSNNIYNNCIKKPHRRTQSADHKIDLRMIDDFDISCNSDSSSDPNQNYSYQKKHRQQNEKEDEYEYKIQKSSAHLIDEHLQEIQVRINGHSTAALRYQQRDRILGYPVTLLSSFVASTFMINISSDKNNDQNIVNIIGFSLSLISFVLSLSRDYLNDNIKFQAHDISSKLYTTLLRSIEIRLIGSHITIAEKRDMFKDIIDQMSIIEQYELPIPADINAASREEIFLPRSVVINNALHNDE